MASADSLECLSCRNTVNYKSYFNTSLILAQITNCERRHIVCCTAMNTEVNQSNKKRQGSPVVRVLASELEITPQICCATREAPEAILNASDKLCKEVLCRFRIVQIAPFPPQIEVFNICSQV